jgi:hypothetical protein
MDYTRDNIITAAAIGCIIGILVGAAVAHLTAYCLKTKKTHAQAYAQFEVYAEIPTYWKPKTALCISTQTTYNSMGEAGCVNDKDAPFIV